VINEVLLVALLIYLIPQHLALGLLAWSFDWLPHHGLDVAAKKDGYFPGEQSARGLGTPDESDHVLPELSRGASRQTEDSVLFVGEGMERDRGRLLRPSGADSYRVGAPTNALGVPGVAQDHPQRPRRWIDWRRQVGRGIYVSDAALML
jgi:hypothetical protein